MNKTVKMIVIVFFAILGIVVALYSLSLLYNSSNGSKSSHTYEASEKIDIDYQSPEERPQVAMNCIAENNIINDKAKNDLVQMEPFLEDHAKLYSEESFDAIYNRIKTLTISYEESAPEQYSDLAAKYVNKYNIITVYEDKYDTPEKGNEIFMHEVFHVLANNKGMYIPDKITGYALSEGITQQLKTEYIGNNFLTYPNEQLCVRLLCEIVGPEEILRAQLNGDATILIHALTEITGTESDVLNLLRKMDTMSDQEDELNAAGEDYIRSEKLSEIKESIISDMNRYFIAKYNIDPSDDPIQSIYIKLLRGERTQTIDRGYFNPRYKNGEIILINYESVENEDGTTKSALIPQETLEEPNREAA